MSYMSGTALISEALLHQWADQGSRSVRSQLQAAIKTLPKAAANAASGVETPGSLYRLLYELLWIVLQTKLSRQDVLTLLNEIELVKSPAACDVLIDLLWVIGNEVEAKEKGRERYSSSEWQTLTRFVRSLAEEEIVPVMSLRSALEVDLLHHAGLLGEPATMNKKLVRVNTKTYYTQVKFNLLREESEGFAKVVSLLHTGVSKHQLAASKTDLMALIGYFDLDANRVLDLTLDAYEMQPTNDAFADLLGLFKRDSIPHVLGFKFQLYKRESTEGLSTPNSLYRLAATLVEKKLVDIDSLLPHLSPSKEETVLQSHEKAKQMEKAAKAFGKVNLGGKSMDADAESSKEHADKNAAAAAKKHDDNQVLGLIMGMLEVGAHERAFEMIKWFKERGVDALAHEPLMKQMCLFVDSLLTTLYAPLSLKTMDLTGVAAPPLNAAAAKKAMATKTTAVSNALVTPLVATDDWLAQLLPVLAILGGNLHNHAFLFTKILRIVGHYLDQAIKESDPAHSTKLTSQLKTLLIESFLPALSLQSCNPSTAFQLWDLLKNLPFDERYRLYQQWEALYATNAQMQLIDAQCVQNTRKVMRRLTADRAKPSARSLTHIAHSNPLVVFRTMLRQIQSYDNLIQPVVESLKFVTPFGMDVLSYVLVSELAKSRQSMKSDGTNISLWLASLANFSGSFYRKYPNVELGGLLQYLIQRLHNWESVDLIVLSELLSKMGSCITFEDISASQLEAQAGGPHLWQEPTDPKLTNRRAIPRLRDALIKRDLALPLCLLICQVRSKMEFQDDSPLNHLKSLGRMFDTSQMTLNQLLQFLNGVVEPTVYTKMLPTVTELVQDYHIAPELAMTLCRPAIRSEDEIFKKAPRSVHASTTVATPTAAHENGSMKRKTWEMESTLLLEDVARGISSSSFAKDPFTGMTTEFYVVFWSMILYDIHVPFPQYETEIGRLRTSISSMQRSGGAGNNSTVTASELKKQKEKATQMIDKLTHEQKDQVAHRKRVYERLEAKKASFFQREDKRSQTAVTELLQKCIVPRALLSPEDALFCAKFMERLHHINTPEFVTVQYYTAVTLQLPSIVLCVTEREAGNFGVFLHETMKLLYRWNQSSVTYDEEAIHGKSGFSVDLNNPALVLTHRQYKAMYAKCHRSMVLLYSKALGSGEYMSIRNSLIVLTKVIDVFPSGKTAAECLLEIVEKLTQEDREDIKIMARRYFALLTKRKTTLVEDKLLAAGLTAPKKVVVVEQVAATVTSSDERDETTSSRNSQPSSSLTKDSAAVELKERSRDRDRDRSSRDGREDRRGGGRGGGESDDRSNRRGASVLRDDALETGEVTGESSKDKDKSERGVPSRLKRRDSDRDLSRATGSSGSAAASNGDAKRDRRGGNERESGATPQKASSGRSDTASERSRPMASDTDGKREAREQQQPQPQPSRRSRSRSPEKRRAQRDRERERERERGASSQKETAEVVSSVKREPSAVGSVKREPPAVAAASASSSVDDGESRKRQRVESTEAALRRQLTEKKDQPKLDAAAEPFKPVNAAAPPRRDGGERGERSSAKEVAAKEEASVESAPAKKMVSLVSLSARKRVREASETEPLTPTGTGSGSGSRNADEGSSSQETKRRRDGGSGAGSNAPDDQGNRGAKNDQQQQQRRNGDDRRKQQQNQNAQQQNNRSSNNQQQKQKGDGNGNNNGQQRDQSRNNRPDHQRGGGGSNRGGGGGGGNANNERRRDSNGNNNNGENRRGGGGGGGGGGGNRR